LIGIAVAFVAAAGVGGLARAGIGHRLNGRFPWGTIVVNVSGSFALGLIARWSGFAATVLGTGLLGAYTTYSSFARDTVALWEQHHRVFTASYVVSTVVLCVLAAWLGLRWNS